MPAKAPANETPEQRFVRVGSKRVTKALDAIDLIGNLTGSSYKSTPAQRDKIVKALETAVADVKDALTTGKVKTGGFAL